MSSGPRKPDTPLRRDDRDVGPLLSAQQWMGVCGRFWTRCFDRFERLLREDDARKSARPKQSDR